MLKQSVDVKCIFNFLGYLWQWKRWRVRLRNIRSCP